LRIKNRWWLIQSKYGINGYTTNFSKISKSKNDDVIINRPTFKA
jgi:hypothetical protein